MLNKNGQFTHMTRCDIVTPLDAYRQSSETAI